MNRSHFQAPAGQGAPAWRGRLAREKRPALNQDRKLSPLLLLCLSQTTRVASLKFAERNANTGQGGRGRPLHAFTPTSRRTMASSGIQPCKYKYRRRLPHLQKDGAALFVTFCTHARLGLSSEARQIVLDHCLREGGLRGSDAGGGPHGPRSEGKAGEDARPTRAPRIHLHAIVVMPDHVHFLLSPCRDENGWPYPLVEIMQCLKATTAHRINKLLSRAGPVWEEESFDHVLRSDESLKEKAEYIRENPHRAGLIRDAEQYRWLWVDPELSR